MYSERQSLHTTQLVPQHWNRGRNKRPASQAFQQGIGLRANQQRLEILQKQHRIMELEMQRQVALKFHKGTSFSFLSLQAQTNFFKHSTNFEQDSRPRGVIEAFVKICQRWNLGEDQQIALLGLQVNESASWLFLKGLIRSRSRDVDDRAGYIVAIGLGLFALFGGSKQAEIEWLHHSQKILQNKSPLHFMLEGQVEHLNFVAKVLRIERGA